MRISSRNSRASLPLVVVLPEPCKPAIRITAGGTVARSSGDIGLAHQRGQLVEHHAHHGLARRQAAHYVLSERTLLHPRDEVLHHRQGYVGLEQRHAHLAQCVLDVGLGEPRLAAQRLEHTGETIGQVVEHGAGFGCVTDTLGKLANSPSGKLRQGMM